MNAPERPLQPPHKEWEPNPDAEDEAHDRAVQERLDAETFGCPYCGKDMPSGMPHPAVWACCGEVGHAVKLNQGDLFGVP